MTAITAAGSSRMRFDQPEHGVVAAHRLEAVPLLDEIHVDAEVERGEQHAGAERKHVAEEDVDGVSHA